MLQPAAFIDVVLSPRVEAVLAKKIPPSKSVQPDDTSVIVSVNDRTERDLNRTFDKMDIDWAEIEEQLMEWGELCRAGKKLRLNVSFNHKEAVPGGATVCSSRGTRGRKSATRIMLAERAFHLDAQEASTGQAALWASMYRLMRCPGPPCDLGPHCWIDSDTKKHYRLKAHHMRQLIEHVQQVGNVETHDDVPQIIRDQLYTEERDRSPETLEDWCTVQREPSTDQYHQRAATIDTTERSAICR